MFGRTLLQVTGRDVRVSSDGQPVFPTGGTTVDWNTVAAATQDTTLADDTIIRNGQKGLRFGQVLTKIGVTATDVLTLNNAPTGGTFTVAVTTSAGTQTTAGIAYNAAAAALQTALQGLSNVGAGNATVTGGAGGPYTIVFPNTLGAVAVVGNGASLTGAGAQPTATVAVTAAGGNVGKWGPYDPNATDGRAVLARGTARIVNVTTLQYNQPGPLVSAENTYPQTITGGKVWKDRLLANTTANSLAAGPTFANLEAALPLLEYTQS